MKWFKHLSDLALDEEVAAYLDEAGKDALMAYGFLTLVLEAVASRMEYVVGDLVCSATYSIRQWGRITHSQVNRTRKYLQLCEVIGWVQVEFAGDSCRVTIPRMVEWRDEYTRKSGHTPDKVAQSREDKNRLDENRSEKRESRQESSLSDSSTGMEPTRTPPHNFKVTQELRQWATEKRPDVDIDRETESFLIYEFSKPIADWVKAWKRWILNAKPNKESGPRRNSPSLDEAAKEHGVTRGADESEEKFGKRVRDAMVMADYGYNPDQFRQ